MIENNPFAVKFDGFGSSRVNCCLEYHNDGDYICAIGQSRFPVVDTHVDGRQVRFKVDTCASITIIDTSKYQALGKPKLRAISLLCTMSKLFERVIMARLLEWVNSKNILSKYQAGFRKHKQTLDHIFRITQYVQAAFNRGHLVGSLFIDIEKAFDNVWHDGLLYKIHRLEIPAYLGKWISNYLDSRTFSVRINGSFSLSTPILAGVPQGSVLGSLLFNIFLNDIVDCQTSPHIEQALFADDVAAWSKAFKLQHIQSSLQNQLNNMAQWTSKQNNVHIRTYIARKRNEFHYQ